MKVFRLLLCWVFLVTACLLQAELIHRYQFADNLNDSKGSINGVEFVDLLDPKIVSPEFIETDRPGGATGKSIDFDVMRDVDSGILGDTTQKSLFTLGHNVFAGSQSFAFWFKMDPRNTTGLVDYIFNFSGANGLVAYVNSNNTLALRNTSGTLVTVTENISDSTWYHLAVTWNEARNKMSAYLNGFAFATDETVNLGDSNVGIFGAHSSSTASPDALANAFDGQLYDLQFYSNRLEVADIALLAAAPDTIYEVPELSNTGLLLGLVITTYFIARRRFLPDAV